MKTLKLSGKTWAACFLLSLCTLSHLSQAQTPQRDVALNIAQLTSSGSVEVQQDLLSIAMNTTASGTDASAVQTQLKHPVAFGGEINCSIMYGV